MRIINKTAQIFFFGVFIIILIGIILTLVIGPIILYDIGYVSAMPVIAYYSIIIPMMVGTIFWFD